MNRNLEEEIAVRDKFILALQRENKIQDKMMKGQEKMIETLQQQVNELHDLMNDILNP